MKLAYVVPRYGPPADIGGGAEGACRLYAEQAARLDGWSVEVLTTTSRRGGDWHDEYPPGTTVEGGVRVHRFPLGRPRRPEFHQLLQRVIIDPAAAPEADQQRFAAEVGPDSPELLDAVAASDADLLSFSPYLFSPTIRGVPLAPGRAVLQPAAHDEPPIRLPLFTEVFAGASGLLFFTPPEQRLVRGLFDVDAIPQTLVGMGVDSAPGDDRAFRSAFGLGDDPYLLCIGRVDRSKGAISLARFFTAYKRLRAGPLKLVMSGILAERPEPHDDIVVTGPIEEGAKWGALRGATALVSPSYYESFSIVLMEAWSIGLPVIVNGRCEITTGHVRRSGGGLAFDGFASFVAAVEWLLERPEVGARMGAAGRGYVDDNFRWPRVIDHYARFLEMVGERAGRARSAV